MAKKMLVDAAHAEELRVVVCENGRIEEFDYQNQEKKSTKGNIYLVKVTRVEPSLQAAFIEFGGNRHGFLPFSEIHPFYYQIPTSDKEKLLEEMKSQSQGRKDTGSEDSGAEGEEDLAVEDNGDFESDYDMNNRPQFYRRYHIQEVIKKDQIILVQLEKEERGSKGASFTTYISLAGRYCVLMPNATKGGGVSRKIHDDQDRQRLKKIAAEITDDSDGQGAVIIRTAGGYKTKTEIRRDYQYLVRLWNNIREHTIKSKAPSFIHEEGDVIKKAIRDLYNNDIEEILVEGKNSFEEAREFMKLILPKHVNKIKHYDDKLPLLARYGIEEQLAELYSNQVRLRSGGYLVINQTEALVAIDVNSGRATKERNVENTALQTNIEAARKIAEQLRLRDLSGLIVVDFIDMEDVGNRKAVERELKNALSRDKAKIQIGRISNFGLLEMSRQRLNQSLLESNTIICEHCNGRGRIRHTASTAIVVLRAIEREIASLVSGQLMISGSQALIMSLMNTKREQISTIEKKFNGNITFYIDESAGGDGFFIEKKAVQYKKPEEKAASSIDQALYVEENDLLVEEEEEIIPVRTQRRNQSFTKGKRQHGERPRRDRQGSGNQEEAKSRGTKIRHKHNSNFHPKAQKPNMPQDAESIDAFYQQQDHEEIAADNMHNLADGPRKSFRNGKKNRFKKFQNKNQESDFNRAAPVSSVPEVSDDVSEVNPKELAERRKQNQSLLKEIWKKIVE